MRRQCIGEESGDVRGPHVLVFEVDQPAGPLDRLGVPARNGLLAELGEGEMFGEMVLLTRKPRSASVVALEATTCGIIEQSDFDQLLAEHPGAVRTIMAALAERLGVGGHWKDQERSDRNERSAYSKSHTSRC